MVSAQGAVLTALPAPDTVAAPGCPVLQTRYLLPHGHSLRPPLPPRGRLSASRPLCWGRWSPGTTPSPSLRRDRLLAEGGRGLRGLLGPSPMPWPFPSCR